MGTVDMVTRELALFASLVRITAPLLVPVLDRNSGMRGRLAIGMSRKSGQ
jgi:hypothetical protein